MPRQTLLLALLIALLPGLAGRCGGGFKTIRIDAPLEGALIDDSAAFAAARIGANFDAQSAQVRIDGIDLIAALALAPPFQGESGVVMIGPDPVTLTGFSFSAGPGTRSVALSAAGLAQGPHVFEVSAALASGQGSLVRGVNFEQTGLFSLEVPSFGASGLPFGPVDVGAEGVLANAIFGAPLAAQPVGLSGGGALRPGPIPVIEARITGGTP